jgi:uncharacterized membrane protein
MSLWVRLLVVVLFLIFVGFALLTMINGESKAALGALFVAGLISPLLVEVFWPGRYVLRKPDDEVEDNLFNRLKQCDETDWVIRTLGSPLGKVPT